MLKLKCSRCRTVLLEAEERWERVAKTGMCRECSWFYDEALELEAQRIADDPRIISSTRGVRAYEVMLGLGAITVALIGAVFLLLLARVTGHIVIFFALGFLFLFGVRTLLHGLAYNPRREARSTRARPTNLRALAERQAAAGVFFEKK
jgi:hypothetical protein